MSQFSYTEAEICDLYKLRRLHPQTIRAWAKEGLPVMKSHKPALIFGQHLIDFLKKRNASRKVDMDFGEFFCMSCKIPHIPLGRRVYVSNEGKTIKARGLCPNTKKTMIKIYKMDDFGEVKKNFNLVDESGLYDSLTPDLRTHLQAHNELPKNESPKQGELPL
jgi:hypothetical protein